MKPKGFALVVILLIITIGIVGYFGYKQFKSNIQNTSLSSHPQTVTQNLSPKQTTIQIPITNYPSITPIEYKRITAYGLEITEEQKIKLDNYLKIEETQNIQPSFYFNKIGGWYKTEVVQSSEFYIKDNYMCELMLLWCGGLNTNNSEHVKRVKEACLTYNIDYNNFNDWMKSNTGQCCKGLFDNTTHILSCVKTGKNDNKPLSEELLFTYQLLKDSGADCQNYNCPPALEKEIIYY